MGGASKLLVLLSTPFPRLCPRSSFFRLARPAQFPLPSFPAAFVAQHRFPFSSSSHPSHGLPPSAARQMHTQTGRRVDWVEPSASPADHKVSFHPWPELSTLVEHLNSIGYADRRVPPAHGEDDDSFLAPEELPEDFRRMAGLCLLYARERPDLLRSLSKRDIEVVVDNGSPFLFKNGSNTVRRLKSFIGGDGSEVLESEQACTVDVMRYLLSYACNSLASTGVDVTRCREEVESSVRNLLCELVKIDVGIQEPNTTNSTARLNPFGYEQSPKPLRQNIEMKRGDWICPKCTFMNFARNMKCLGCYEVCPKRQLTDGEWECPQCDFFNYARNMTCLRCDCKRPGEISSSGKPSIEQLLSAGNVDRAEIERRLAENDEKAERWFSKVSQLDDSSDVSSAIADEDFPEIMPLRKGTNRFVISTRRTPLERRLANAQYRKNLGNEGSYMGNDSLRMGSNKMSESAISHTLDRILGRSSAASGTSDDAGNQIGSREPSGSSFTSAESKEQTSTRDFASVKSSNSSQLADTLSTGSRPEKPTEPFQSRDFNSLSGGENVNNQALSKTVKDSSDSTDRWSKKFAQSATPDNRRDHSPTPPHYKRRIAMDQANNSNFVPFVPFPPDYFAKDKQPEAMEKSATESSYVSVGNDKSIPQKVEENRIGYSYEGGANNTGQTATPKTSGDTRNCGFSRTNLDGRNVAQQTSSIWNNNPASRGSAIAREVTTDGVSASSNLNRQQVENPQKTTENWNHGFPGKSLEGSAVTEPDPLDMSEEAKAQRWFRRVAQIKDISELSKIPDEDFPEIMPMRKGVNRFVVSKRKTPLERRLTSPQYRRNLPIVSSEPGKDPARE